LHYNKKLGILYSGDMDGVIAVWDVRRESIKRPKVLYISELAFLYRSL